MICDRISTRVLSKRPVGRIEAGFDQGLVETVCLSFQPWTKRFAEFQGAWREQVFRYLNVDRLHDIGQPVRLLKKRRGPRLRRLLPRGLRRSQDDHGRQRQQQAFA